MDTSIVATSIFNTLTKGSINPHTRLMIGIRCFVACYFSWSISVFNLCAYGHTFVQMLSFRDSLHLHRQRDRQSDRQSDRQTERQTDRATDRQTDRVTDRVTDRQSDRQTDRQTDRQSDRQSDRQTE